MRSPPRSVSWGGCSTLTRPDTGGPIDVWRSDQGFYPDERYVTYDLALVLRLTRYYAENGRLI